MFVYECKVPKKTTEKNSEKSNMDSADILSFDIKNIRDEIKKVLQTDEPFSFIYPIDDILGNLDEDEFNVSAGGKDTDIIAENELGIDEVKKMAMNIYNEKVDVVLSDLFADSIITDDISTNKIVLIKNLNLKCNVYRIDDLCLRYKKVLLIKPRLSNPIDDTVYLLLLRNDDNSNNRNAKSVLPTNAEGIIDFMYCLYYYGLYITKLSLSMVVNNNLNRIKNIKMSVDQEYKQYIKLIVDKLRELNVKIY